ncbi:MAG: fructose-1,6-bisphosphatase [Candidatus Aenigmatarchaeota archaeon]
MKDRMTISLIKADVGSVCGHHTVHPKQLELAKELLEKAKKKGKIIDYYVFNCGDDLELLMTHEKGENSPEIHGLAWEILTEVTEKVSNKLHLYAAGQDILKGKEVFSGNVKGLGPVAVELEIGKERPSEPFIVLAADKAEAGVFNYYFFNVFANPLNTAGLVIDPEMHEGFTFKVVDVIEGKSIELSCPNEMYDLLALIGTTGRYLVERVWRTKDKLLAAVAGISRLSLIAGIYKGKDDNAAIVRLQLGLPALGEALAPFAIPYLTKGWMRGSHVGPLMPSSLRASTPTYFDGPPRIVCLGFNLCEGKLVGLNGNEPTDIFADTFFDEVRRKASEIAIYLRQHGEFEPERLGMEELEYTGIMKTLEKLKERFK